MNKSNKSSLFKTSLIAALLVGALNAEAAGLGKLTVYSAIGQPLNAEVALTASKDELTSISAKLASHAAFNEAGIDFTPALAGLRFAVVKREDGQHLLKLSTDHPLNEPFLHFLVELSWATGRVVREYTFLLDPPESLQVTRAASVVAPAIPQKLPQEAARPVTPPLAAPVSAGVEEYRVKLGDTLGKIARETKVEHVSLDQMLVALFNSNREAFDGANMNRLRAGKILRVPDAGQAAAIDPAAARKIVISQTADFNAYRRRLAEAAAAAPAGEERPQQLAEGKIEARTEGKAPAVPATDKLEVSRTEAAKSAKPGKSHLEEELVAREKALKEASERIAQLEKNLENLKQLVEIKSQAGAQLQQQAAPMADKKPEPAEQKQKVAPPAPAPSAPAAEKPVEAVAAAVKPEAAQPEAAKPEAPKAPPAPEKKKPAAPPPPPPPEPSFVEDNPELVFGGAGLIALLLGYFGYNAWRKKKAAAQAAAFPAQAAESAGIAAAPTAVPAVAASETPLENAEVSILGDFSESGVLTTEESVDPVAEADVLMAYGRDAQAEEILLEGLKADPTRSAIHAKLLELYAQRGDAAKFEPVATELYALSAGEGAEWEKAVGLAQGLGITHGVFAAATPAAETEEAAIAAEVPETAPAPASEAVAEVPAAETHVEVPPAAEAGGGSLDFDLDLGTTSMPAAAESVGETSAAAPAADEVMSLDFDFDLGTPSAPEAAAEPAPVAEAVAEAGGSVDFAIEAAVGEPAAAETPAMPVEAPAIEAAALDFDLDLGSDVPPPASAPPTAAEKPIDALQLDEISLDLGEPAETARGVGAAVTDQPGLEMPASPVVERALDMDLGMEPEIGGEPAKPAVAPPAIELPDIDLSLDVGSVPAVAAEPAPEPQAIDIDLGGPEGGVAAPEALELDDPEVATKLELAQAYEEMGDREGARELLSEVLNEGSAAQRAAAQARLDQLLV